MSYLDTKQALVQQLLTVGSADDIAFENKKFVPDGKDLWYSAFFIPATTDMMGKTPTSSDEQRGIFQVSVFIDINDNNYDNSQLSAIDLILSGFKYNTSIVYNSQKVDILDSTVNDGLEDSAWYKRDISINYLTFSERV